MHLILFIILILAIQLFLVLVACLLLLSLIRRNISSLHISYLSCLTAQNSPVVIDLGNLYGSTLESNHNKVEVFIAFIFSKIDSKWFIIFGLMCSSLKFMLLIYYCNFDNEIK